MELGKQENQVSKLSPLEFLEIENREIEQKKVIIAKILEENVESIYFKRREQCFTNFFLLGGIILFLMGFSTLWRSAHGFLQSSAALFFCFASAFALGGGIGFVAQRLVNKQKVRSEIEGKLKPTVANSTHFHFDFFAIASICIILLGDYWMCIQIKDHFRGQNRIYLSTEVDTQPQYKYINNPNELYHNYSYSNLPIIYTLDRDCFAFEVIKVEYIVDEEGKVSYDSFVFDKSYDYDCKAELAGVIVTSCSKPATVNGEPVKMRQKLEIPTKQFKATHELR